MTKSASSSKARRQVLHILIIDRELKLYVPSVLKYYNKVFLKVMHEVIRSI